MEGFIGVFGPVAGAVLGAESPPVPTENTSISNCRLLFIGAKPTAPVLVAVAVTSKSQVTGSVPDTQNLTLSAVP